MEFIGEMLVYFMNYPGAFIRWILFRKKKTFKQLMESNESLNRVLGLTVVIILIILLNFC